MCARHRAESDDFIAGGTTAQPTQSVYGTVSAPAIEPATIGTAVTIYDNGAAAGTATVLSDGAWAANITLVNGANTITAADTDAAGITGTSNSVSYTLAIPPVVSITSPGVLLSSAVQTVSGTVAPGGAAIAGTTVKLMDNGVSIGTATVNDSGAWSVNVTLSCAPITLSL